MEAGQFKVAAHLSDWWEEFRLYHRKNGRIHKERDDLMDATRYLVMSLRFARRRSGTRTRLVARTTLDDYDVFDS
jgi:N-glycosylase/DNA lyase